MRRERVGPRLAFLSITAGAVLVLAALSMCACGYPVHFFWPREEWVDDRGISHTIIVPEGDGAESELQDYATRMKDRFPEKPND